MGGKEQEEDMLWVSLMRAVHAAMFGDVHCMHSELNSAVHSPPLPSKPQQMQKDIRVLV